MVNVSSPAVLLVEPYEDAREMYAEYLASCGFRPTGVASGDEALDRVTGADIVVTGIQIDGSFDGLELLRRVRRQAPETPIIVLTACVGGSYRDQAQQAGCAAFLAKPCTPDVLVAEIRDVLAHSRELREQSHRIRTRAADSLRRANRLLKKSSELRDRFWRGK